MSFLPVLVTALLACTDPKPDDDPTGDTADTAPTVVIADPEVVLAPPRWLAVGDAMELPSLGPLLGHGSLDARGELTVDHAAGTLACSAGGVGWLRADYRLPADENHVQTLVVACVDETGDCTGLDPIVVQLDPSSAGDTTWSAGADGTLYGLCEGDGGVRLDPGALDPPPPIVQLGRAYGPGPNALDALETPPLRDAPWVSWSGDALSPSIAAHASHTLESIDITAKGAVVIDPVDCAISATCSDDPLLLTAGDTLVVGFEAPGGLLEAVLATDPVVIDDFVTAHIETSWSDTAGWDVFAARQQVVFRLVGLRIMEALAEQFDDLYGLRSQGIRAVWSPDPDTRAPLSATCAPSDATACDAVEAELLAAEAAVIAELAASGLDLWYEGTLAWSVGGAYEPLSAQPAVGSFAGAWITLPDGPPEEAPAMAAALSGLAAELAGLPVVLAPSAPDWADGAPTPARFGDRTTRLAPSLVALPDAFAPGQVVGFAIGSFDGEHCDLEQPVETLPAGSFDRITRTGFLDPLWNAWLTR